MTRSSTLIIGGVAACGAALALAVSPSAAAAPSPLLPQCQVTGGSQLTGDDTQCASPGNVEINDTPSDAGGFGYGGGFYGFPGFGFY